jgi:hypothetical protein
VERSSDVNEPNGAEAAYPWIQHELTGLDDARMNTESSVPKGKPLLVDQDAESAEVGLAAFLARPSGAPVYYGFPLVEETRTEGWCFGAITEFAEPEGCDCGDGFVEAPDGSRAGLIWSVGSFPIEQTLAPTADRWGVWAVPFPKPIRDISDLVACFRYLLPELKRLHSNVANSFDTD